MTARWSHVLDRLNTQGGRLVGHGENPARLARIDQAYEAIRQLLDAHGVDTHDRDQVLATAVGVDLVSVVASKDWAPEERDAVNAAVTVALGCINHVLPPGGRTWSLEFDERPWTSNGQSSRRGAQGQVRRWRGAFHLLAMQSKIPRLERIDVAVEPIFTNARSIQDSSACHPAAKAAIDGLVDAGVIKDDRPPYLRNVTYRPVLIDRTRRRDALRLTVTELSPPLPEVPPC